jgi:SAM-dependent methyltransferase
MSDYYTTHFMDYHQKTVSVIPLFLRPFIDRLEKGSSILDVGCGSGRDLLFLKKAGFAVTGFEKSPGLAHMAEVHSGCNVIRGDFETDCFASLKVNAILLSGALVHVPGHRMGHVLQNILKALHPQAPDRGLVYISLKEGFGTTTDETGRTFYLWQDDRLRVLYDQCGLVVLHFDRNVSTIDKDDIWLGYVLRKNTG